MSWWDYGYQITAMANRTILVDNNTWNNTHISRVGQVNMSRLLLLLLLATCINYADLNSFMLRMRGHFSAGFFRCDVLFLQGFRQIVASE